MVYFFPKGCDARYWRSFAAATARAGRYEDFEILPKERQAAPKSMMTRQRLDELLKGRKKKLRNAADEDARYEKTNPTPPRDYMPMI